MQFADEKTWSPAGNGSRRTWTDTSFPGAVRHLTASVCVECCTFLPFTCNTTKYIKAENKTKYCYFHIYSLPGQLAQLRLNKEETSRNWETWLIGCLTARQHRKVNLCQLREEGKRLSRLRIANEIQSTLP